MHGHSHEESRTMRYDGTRATLRAKFAYGMDDVIEIHDHLTGCVERIHPQAGGSGHGGGDEGVMAGFVRAVRDPSTALTTAGSTLPVLSGAEGLTTSRESLESHLMAFAAEQARVETSIVELAAYRQRAEGLGKD